MDKEYTVSAIVRNVYKVTYNGKSKLFLSGGANIHGWVAKQAMLPVFDEYNRKYGESEIDDNMGGVHLRRVWDDWEYRKNIFVLDMFEAGVEYAKQQLVDYFENDYC